MIEDKSAAIEKEEALLLKLLQMNPRKKYDSDLGSALMRRKAHDYAYWRVTTWILQDAVLETGYAETFENGKQTMQKQTPEFRSLLDAQKNVSRLGKELREMAKDAGSDSDELMEFLGK